MAHEVVDRVYRLGSGLVNWFVVEDGGKLTVVDAGLPKQFEQLPVALAEIGRSLNDVEAVLLTHAHSDHIGSTVQITNSSGATVHVHHADVALAQHEASSANERRFVRDLYHPHMWKLFIALLRGGISNTPPIRELAGFEHGEMLDIPGRPRVIHTPGHTDGSACLALPHRNVLFTGDALVTLSMTTGQRTPRIMPRSFNKSSQQALESLDGLKGLSTEVILPGHGEPWHGSIAAAVAAAQQTGPN